MLLGRLWCSPLEASHRMRGAKIGTCSSHAKPSCDAYSRTTLLHDAQIIRRIQVTGTGIPCAARKTLLPTNNFLSVTFLPLLLPHGAPRCHLAAFALFFSTASILRFVIYCSCFQVFCCTRSRIIIAFVAAAAAAHQSGRGRDADDENEINVRLFPFDTCTHPHPTVCRLRVRFHFCGCRTSV